MSSAAQRITAIVSVTLAFTCFPVVPARSADITFASHFLNIPDLGPARREWGKKHRLKAYHRDFYDRCSAADRDSGYQLSVAAAHLITAMNMVEADLVFLSVYAPLYERSGTKDTAERYEERRAELVQVITEASPVVTEKFRVVSGYALFDWSSIKCEEYGSKFYEYRDAIVAFNAAFKPYREQIKAIRTKYKRN